MKTLSSVLFETFDDKLKGGLGDKKSPSDFDQQSLMQGIHVEVEHTNDILMAMEIAMDHLAEDPRYYKKLSQMES